MKVWDKTRQLNKVIQKQMVPLAGTIGCMKSFISTRIGVAFH